MQIFPAFARKNAPATNLAELIDSKWKTTGGTHLSLEDAAAEDIKDSLLSERQYRGYEAVPFVEEKVLVCQPWLHEVFELRMIARKCIQEISSKTRNLPTFHPGPMH